MGIKDIRIVVINGESQGPERLKTTIAEAIQGVSDLVDELAPVTL